MTIQAATILTLTDNVKAFWADRRGIWWGRRWLPTRLLAGVGPQTYLRAAIEAALHGGTNPLPHELASGS